MLNGFDAWVYVSKYMRILLLGAELYFHVWNWYIVGDVAVLIRIGTSQIVVMMAAASESKDVFLSSFVSVVVSQLQYHYVR